MSLNLNDFSSGSGGGGQFGSVPVGAQYGRLVQIVDKGVQERQPYQGKAKDPVQMILFTYSLPYLAVEIDGVRKQRWISVTRPASRHAKSGMTKDLAVLDPANQATELSQLLTTPVMVNVEQRTDAAGNPQEGTKLGSITPLPAGTEIAPLDVEPRVFDMSNPDLDVFNELPEWLQNDIKSALNFPGSALQSLLASAAQTPATAGVQAQPQAAAQLATAPQPPQQVQGGTLPQTTAPAAAQQAPQAQVGQFQQPPVAQPPVAVNQPTPPATQPQVAQQPPVAQPAAMAPPPPPVAQTAGNVPTQGPAVTTSPGVAQVAQAAQAAPPAAAKF